jgi:hypothetical protein
MRDKRANGIKRVREVMRINQEHDRGLDRMLLELRLSYHINISREDLIGVALGSLLAKPVEFIADYIRRL